MSPILVRPVREQLEHDRVIRLLQARFRRRFDVSINPGAEQNAGVSAGGAGVAVYPDVVLISQDRGRTVMAVIEVETVESVNNLEALAEWVPFGRLKSAFHLYVPAQMFEVAKRLCTDSNIPVAEIYSYHWIGDEMRFVPVYKAPADGRTSTATLAAKIVTPKAVVPKPPPVKAAVPKVAAAKPAAKPVKAPKTQKPTRKPAARKPAAKSGKKLGRSSKRK